MNNLLNTYCLSQNIPSQEPRAMSLGLRPLPFPGPLTPSTREPGTSSPGLRPLPFPGPLTPSTWEPRALSLGLRPLPFPGPLTPSAREPRAMSPGLRSLPIPLKCIENARLHDTPLLCDADMGSANLHTYLCRSLLQSETNILKLTYQLDPECSAMSLLLCWCWCCNYLLLLFQQCRLFPWACLWDLETKFICGLMEIAFLGTFLLQAGRRDFGHSSLREWIIASWSDIQYVGEWCSFA